MQEHHYFFIEEKIRLHKQEIQAIERNGWKWNGCRKWNESRAKRFKVFILSMIKKKLRA